MDAAFAAKLARRSQLNHEAMTAFAGMISGLVGLIIALDLLRRFGARKRGVYGRFTPSVVISRYVDHSTQRHTANLTNAT